MEKQQKKLDLVQIPSFSSKVQMIPVTKFLVYRELSLNVPDPSGEVHTVEPSATYLAVDHMAHGYSQPHPHALHVVEVQLVQNGPHQHAGAQPCCVAVGFVQSGRIGGIVVFNITNHFPQEYGLNDSGAFLKGKKGLIRNASSTSFLNTSFTFTISVLKGHFWQNTTFMIHLKRKYLSPVRQADNNFNLKPKFYIQRK